MVDPVKVGILNDMAAGPPGPSDVERWLRLAVEEVGAAGRLEQPVEFVNAWGLGLPSGTAEAVEQAYRELVAEEVLLIVGPAIGDNALVATPLAEACRVPTINWAGTERARGRYMFHLQVGSHEDEAVVIARYLASTGQCRIGVIHDASPIGERYRDFLREEARILDLEPARWESIAPLAESAGKQVEALLEARVDAVVYLGLGEAVPPVARELSGRGFAGPCIMNTAGIRGYYGDFARAVDGWLYVDLFSDRNRFLGQLLDRLSLPAEQGLAAAKGYDLGRLVAEGLARATALSREGLVEGLERIKWLPAAQGQDGTLLGFGHCDRGALHGPYLVLRQWLGGRTLEVERP